MPKLASQQKMYSILRRANQSTSPESRFKPNFVTLAAVAEPQSQKVQRNGQPRFVSQSPIQRSPGLAAISRSNAPERNGEGISSRSLKRGPAGLRTKLPSGFRKLVL